MLDFYGNDLDLRFDYCGRGCQTTPVALCCTQDEMCELVATCLDELKAHWLATESSLMDDWAVSLCEAIIKASGQGALDHMGKSDLVFDIGCYLDSAVVEELKSQDDDCDDD